MYGRLCYGIWSADFGLTKCCDGCRKNDVVAKNPDLIKSSGDWIDSEGVGDVWRHRNVLKLQ